MRGIDAHSAPEMLLRVRRRGSTTSTILQILTNLTLPVTDRRLSAPGKRPAQAWTTGGLEDSRENSMEMASGRRRDAAAARHALTILKAASRRRLQGSCGRASSGLLPAQKGGSNHRTAHQDVIA